VRGRYFLAKSTQEEEIEKSLDYFQQAIEEDPTYALAYVGKADCYILLADFGYLSSKEGYPKIRAATEKALKMDNTLAGAHASLGYVKFKNDWDWAGAERDFKRAIWGGTMKPLKRLNEAWSLILSRRTITMF
jgi:tetratricopeptide (TPR) repeat protein